MTAPLYKQNVTIELTPEQRESLAALLKKAKENPDTGFVIGQYYGLKTMNFQFVTVEEFQEGIAEALRIRGEGKKQTTEQAE